MVSVLRRLSHIALRIFIIYLVSFIMDQRDLSEELLVCDSAVEHDIAEILATPVKAIAGQVMIVLLCFADHSLSINYVHCGQYNTFRVTCLGYCKSWLLGACTYASHKKQ